MQNFNVTLTSPISKSYRCQKAANSLDINVKKKSVHKFSVEADLETPFNVGLIVGASGSGKTTLAHSIWGEQCFETILDLDKPIIDQFPKDWSYEDCQLALSGVGLTSVPCWIRIAATLSNGQRARAEAALLMAQERDIIAIDEWTSVVDRTVAKAMSNCLQKHARKRNRKIVLLSCHYDIIEWLDPDWVIDCNKQQYKDRRLLRRGQRKEKLKFEVRECDRSSWRYFSKYHYLNENLPGGVIRLYGLFEGENQIGFQCFANYKPHSDKNVPMIMHSNRTVIHPDYVGLGLSLPLINHTSADMSLKGFNVMARFSSIPIHRLFERSPSWKLLSQTIPTKIRVNTNIIRHSGYRQDATVFSYNFSYPRYRKEYGDAAIEREVPNG